MTKTEEQKDDGTKRRPGRPRGGQYHWDDWLRRNEFVLQRRIDYFCSQSSMASMIRNEARKRHVYVSIEDVDWGFRVRVSKTPIRQHEG